MTTLKKTGSKNWIDSDFAELDSFSSSKKRSRTESQENASFHRAPPSKKAFIRQTDEELWVNKYKPSSVESLAVQVKKVEEIRAWLLDHLESGGILLLSGPPGCGKTATISALTTELGVELQEWVNPVDQVEYGDCRTLVEEESRFIRDDTVAFSSQTKRFKDWIQGGKYSSLTTYSGGHGQHSKVLLVEDLPGFVRGGYDRSKSGGGELASILKQYSSPSQNKRHPLVFIVSESSGGSRESIQKQVFKPEMMRALRIDSISLNPCTTTNTVKLLARIATSESRNPGGKHAKIPDKQALELVAEATGGDIRGAINALQFSCLRSLGDFRNLFDVGSNNNNNDTATSGVSLSAKKSVSASKKSAKSGGSAAPPSVGGKDQNLVLFHALGKILYSKREANPEPHPLPSHLEHFRRKPLQANPEAVIEKTAISNDAFTCFLHHNYPSFYTDIHAVQHLTEQFSECDLLLREWGTAGKMDVGEYGSSLAARAVMFTHQEAPKVGGMRKLTKPEFYATQRTRDNNMYSIQTSGSICRVGSLKDFITTTLPLLSKTRPKGVSPTVLDIGVMSRGQSSVFKHPIASTARALAQTLSADDNFDEEEEMGMLEAQIVSAKIVESNLQQPLTTGPGDGEHVEEDKEDFIIEDFDD